MGCVGGNFALGQGRVKGRNVGGFVAIIPGIAHEGDDEFNFVARQAFGIVGFSERRHSKIGAAISDQFHHRWIVDGVKHIGAVNDADDHALQPGHAQNDIHLAIVAMTFDAVKRVQILPGGDLVGQRVRDFDGFMFNWCVQGERYAGKRNHEQHCEAGCPGDGAHGFFFEGVSHHHQRDVSQCRDENARHALQQADGGGTIGSNGWHIGQDGEQNDANDHDGHNCQWQGPFGIVAVRRFVDEGQQGEKDDRNAGDDGCANPLDCANERNLPVQGQEFEQEEEIPLRARDVGGVGGVGFGRIMHADKGCQQNEQDEDAQGDDGVFVDAIGPEVFAALEFALILGVDLVFGFLVHGVSPPYPANVIHRA